MKFLTINSKNIDSEHICCAISDKKGENCVGSKKSWLQKRFKDGLVFKRLNERCKVFIEYIPAESAFCPIDANNFMFINCLWVSGKYKSHGYGKKLLKDCIEDSKEKDKKGLVAIGSKKKMHFLTDSKFLKHMGFKIADTAYPEFELLYLPFDNNTKKPFFKAILKNEKLKEKGVTVYFSNGCPHTDKYIPLEEEVLKTRKIEYKIIHLKTKEEAQNAPTPCSIYSLFINGDFITSELLTPKKLNKILDEYKL